MLAPTEAQEAAKREAAELVEDPSWRSAFGSATPRLPVLVKNLSTPERPYYLVDFRTGERSTGRMIIDPETGRARQVSGVDSDTKSMPLFIELDEVDRRIGSEVVLPDGRRIPVPPGTATKQLVWMHSIESRNKFQPLYKLTWSNGLTLYLRIDGSVHEELTGTGKKPR